jgi:hypothetical protein
MERLSFKTYVALKATKLGIKSYQLCKPITEYVWSFIIYTAGHGTTDHSLSAEAIKTAAVVVRLLQLLEHCGHILAVDNCCNSPLLSKFPKSKGMYCVSTHVLSKELFHPD